MPRLKTKSSIDVDLDGADLKWLREQGYPFGVDAAGYLRMMVRRARLEPKFTGVFFGGAPSAVPKVPQYSVETREVDTQTGGDLEPGHPGGLVDVDQFTSAVIGEAEQADAAPQADVVLIGERRQRSAKEWASG